MFLSSLLEEVKVGRSGPGDTAEMCPSAWGLLDWVLRVYVCLPKCLDKRVGGARLTREFHAPLFRFGFPGYELSGLAWCFRFKV